MKTFLERMADHISLVGGATGKILPKNKFNETFNNYDEDICNTLSRELYRQDIKVKNLDQVKEILKNSDVFSNKNATKKTLLNNYNKAYNYLTNYSNSLKQENVANTWDHTKLLLFRVANGVSIATIVLLAAYLADKMQISIPLFRL